MPEVPVARFAELNPRRGRRVVVGDRPLGVFRDGDDVFVLDGDCPHTGGPLGEGDVRDGCAICPFHGWTFSLRTGENVRNADTTVRCYPARVVDGEVLVTLDEPPPPPPAPS